MCKNNKETVYAEVINGDILFGAGYLHCLSFSVQKERKKKHRFDLLMTQFSA